MKRIILSIAIISLIQLVIITIHVLDIDKNVKHIERLYEENLDDLYYYKHQCDSLQKVINNKEKALQITVDECARLRKSNIQYRLQLR